MAIEANAERGQERVGQWQAVRELLPHLWTRIGWDLRTRVGAAVCCLIVAKLTNVYVPILFKAMVDALTPRLGEGGATGATVAIAVPIGLLIAYGLARIATQLFSELRDGIFARVAQRAIRNVALQTFRHLHALSLKFHLDRQTGGLDARDRARRQGHRVPAVLRAVQRAADADRDRAGLRHPVGALRLALRAGDRGHHRRLCLVHPQGHRVAHQVSPRHERIGPERQHQGGRLAAEFRDRQILQQRGARGAPLRRRAAGLRARGGEVAHHLGDAEHRPGLHHRGRRHGHDDHGGAMALPAAP